MKIIVFLLIIVGMYLVGYISGFIECEDITRLYACRMRKVPSIKLLFQKEIK